LNAYFAATWNCGASAQARASSNVEKAFTGSEEIGEAAAISMRTAGLAVTKATRRRGLEKLVPRLKAAEYSASPMPAA
jgi:hypothetical protein